MKTIRTTIQVIGMSVVIFVSGYCGWILRNVFPPSRAGISSASIARPAHILSIIDIQQQLTSLGVKRYDPCGIDGIIGKKTLNAWNNYTFDKYAERYFPESWRPK